MPCNGIRRKLKNKIYIDILIVLDKNLESLGKQNQRPLPLYRTRKKIYLRKVKETKKSRHKNMISWFMGQSEESLSNQYKRSSPLTFISFIPLE